MLGNMMTKILKTVHGLIYQRSTVLLIMMVHRWSLFTSAENLQKKTIVCPKNKTADVIKAKVLGLLHRRSAIYTSFDEAIPHGKQGSLTTYVHFSNQGAGLLMNILEKIGAWSFSSTVNHIHDFILFTLFLYNLAWNLIFMLITLHAPWILPQCHLWLKT